MTARGSGQQRWPQRRRHNDDEEVGRQVPGGSAQRWSYRVEEGPEKASGCGRSSHPPDRGLSGGNDDDHSGRHCHHGRSQSGHQQLQEEVGDASLPPYEEFINGLNMQERMYIELIGLGGLLKTPSIKIRRVLCLAIANSYDAAQDDFIINGRPCRITLEDVAHITGMPCNGKKHIPSNLDDNMELQKKLKDRNDTKITFNGLLAKMKGDRSPNFVRPFVLYTIGKYVCRTKEENVHDKYVCRTKEENVHRSTVISYLTYIT
ncbi:hypothetical protein ZWY2020_051165 [Hordeum vulgare]|nr:hypothetical protein ZWY2020_051165 [Hordeum vulgare]